MKATLTPDGTFLHTYTQHMEDQETATAFDFWSGCWLIACALGRNVVVPRPRAPVYLNTYVALIGDSGIVRKSSAIKEAVALARPLLRNTDIALITAKTTPEALDRLLHYRNMSMDSSQCAIAISEMSTFLGSEGYTIGMPALLTDLYDCGDKREGPGTQKDGPIEQSNIWVSFLTASTPAWLMHTVNPIVSEGGFTSRCLFITASKPKRRIAWPEAPDVKATYARRVQMVEQLQAIQRRGISAGEVTIDDDALAEFRRWYDNRSPSLDVYASTFEAREDAHVLRVAAYLAVNEGTWRITSMNVLCAIQLVYDVKKASGQVFARAGERSRYGTTLELMRTMLINAGMDPIPRGMMFRRLSQHIEHTEFMAMLDVLQEFDAIQRFTLRREDGGPGRPVEYIRGTQLLLSPGIGEKLIQRMAV